MDFEKLAGKAITLFHLQNVPSFVKPINERPTLAIELFNKLKKALSDKDKELAMFYLKGSTEYQQKENEVDSIFQECNQTLSELKDTPPNEVEKIQYEFHQKHKKAHYEMNEIHRKDRPKKEKIEKVENEIKSIVIPISNELINLVNKSFWSKIENDKLIIEREYFNKIEQLNANLNKISIAKYKTYCIAMYAKLHKMKYNHRVGFKPYVQIVNPKNNLKWRGSYFTSTEKKLLLLYEMKFKQKHLNEIVNHLENNEIAEANTIYNDQRQRLKKKTIKNEDAKITYSNHKHKSNANVYFKPLPANTFPLVFKAFFGADVRDGRYRNEPLVYSMIVNDIRRYTGQKPNNEPTPPNPETNDGDDTDDFFMYRGINLKPALTSLTYTNHKFLLLDKCHKLKDIEAKELYKILGVEYKTALNYLKWKDMPNDKRYIYRNPKTHNEVNAAISNFKIPSDKLKNIPLPKKSTNR